jgi:hypothetical protein
VFGFSPLRRAPKLAEGYQLASSVVSGFKKEGRRELHVFMVTPGVIQFIGMILDLNSHSANLIFLKISPIWENVLFGSRVLVFALAFLKNPGPFKAAVPSRFRRMLD